MMPNVSAIYRDLAFMANPISHSENRLPERSSEPTGLIQEKQQRHNQLMEKLRNAQRQSNNITEQLGGNSNPYTGSTSNGSYQSFNTSYRTNEYNFDSNFKVGRRESQINGSWKPPNIRYRHIQDFKQPQIRQNFSEDRPQNIAKVTLEKQFYQEKAPQKGVRRQNERREQFSDNQGINKNTEKINQQDQSQTSYGKTWINRQSKFQDKLESYYQLCRKRPTSKMQPQSQLPSNKAKFTRSGNTRIPDMQLNKAIKLLSLD